MTSRMRMPAAIASDRTGLDAAVAAVRRYTSRVPEVAVVLGSGLGGLADEVEFADVIPVDEIPGYPRSSVAGHAGELVFGVLEGCVVVMVRGRVHCYEGYDAFTAALPVRLVHALGAGRLIVTNAAGGIHPGLRPGSVMLITDHLNMAGQIPIAAVPNTAEHRRGLAAVEQDQRFYDLEWLEEAENEAGALGIPTRRGVYVWTLGPSYETKAEIRFFRQAGADAVGMSTVPEVIQAHQLGMRVLGLSSITNPAAGLEPEALSHDDVLAVGARMQGALRRLIRAVLRHRGEAGRA